MKYTIKNIDKVVSADYLDFYSYEIFESDNYVSVVELRKSVTECASGYTDIVNTYVLDKSTGKELSKGDIIEKYNIDVDDLAKSYNDVMVKEMENYSNDFISVIENGAYYFLINSDNKLYVIIQDEFAPYLNTMILENNKWVYDYNEELFS